MLIENKQELQQSKLHFGVVFFVTLLIVFFCGIFMIKTAQNGITAMEVKKSKYDKILNDYEKTFNGINRLFIDLESLRMHSCADLKDLNEIKRNTSVHKNKQELISKSRLKIEKDIENFDNFDVYKVILSQIESSQSILDDLFDENIKRDALIEQIESCKEKYRTNSLKKSK